MQEDEVKDIPLIWPLVSITLKTTTFAGDKPILNECEEIINLGDGQLAKKQMARLVREFKDYVRKVLETAQDPKGRDALQNILDTHSRAPSPLPEDRPSSPPYAMDQPADTPPEG